jgi:hypothetical protein
MPLEKQVIKVYKINWLPMKVLKVKVYKYPNYWYTICSWKSENLRYTKYTDCQRTNESTKGIGIQISDLLVYNDHESLLHGNISYRNVY